MNPAIEAVRGSLIRELHSRRTGTTLDLGLGQPTLMPNVEYFERATRWVAQHGCRYSSNLGDLDLREAIAAHYAYPELDDAANVCMMTGSQEAVFVAIKTVLDPARDEILIVDPAFPVYEKCALVEGIPVRKVTMPPERAFAFEADAILEALAPNTRLIVIGSPSNPTGRVMSRRETGKLAKALLSRPGPPVYMMHDEIYRELVYTEDVGEFGKVYPYTLAVNSLSKSNALTGLRLGWLIAPGDVMAQAVKMHGWVTSCASTFGQRIAYEIFAADDLGGHRSWYGRQRDGALDAARAVGLDAIAPEGAFYLCLRVGDADGRGFAESLIAERDTIVIPAFIFSDALAGWVRTSFVNPLDVVREGYARLAEHARARGALSPAG